MKVLQYNTEPGLGPNIHGFLIGNPESDQEFILVDVSGDLEQRFKKSLIIDHLWMLMDRGEEFDWRALDSKIGKIMNTKVHCL